MISGQGADLALKILAAPLSTKALNLRPPEGVVMVMIGYGDILGAQTPITWSDDYKIGVEKIDREHEELFNTYGKFIESINSNNAPSSITSTLEIFEDYILYHFSNEESLMLSIGYPDLFSHKLEHLDFRVSVTRFRTAITQGDDINHDFVKFFGHWLISHIMVMDKRISEFIKNSSTA